MVDFTSVSVLADLVELKVEDMVRYFDGPSVMMGCYGISIDISGCSFEKVKGLHIQDYRTFPSGKDHTLKVFNQGSVGV
jgi:hypothetical protein